MTCVRMSEDQAFRSILNSLQQLLRVSVEADLVPRFALTSREGGECFTAEVFHILQLGKSVSQHIHGGHALRFICGTKHVASGGFCEG